jgi:hypothetical protein
MNDVQGWKFEITTTVGSGIVGLTISGIHSGDEEMVAQALASLLCLRHADEVPSRN